MNFNSEIARTCRVAPVSRADATDLIKRHYIGKWPGVVVLSLGLFKSGSLVGICVFALPPTETMKRYGGLTWELARLWLFDEMPRNSETWFMSRAIKYIKQHRPDVVCLVSYADPSQNHVGTIYRAGNWVADGRTDDDRKTPRFDYVDAVTGKHYSRRGHVPAGAAVLRKPRVSKYRFLYRLR